ncbi:AMP-binding protein [Nocardioides piscis]|uniref:Propionyl-CoA synthetase n=1 Tax=Nocardioides piscis TaxID=2714938 RepID=A0A6G7YJM5_9ACTN|nr:AMP-binding protein [Nocardioides piscis]QIK76951.1 propionyl-CoA synthetase [Nocardioides piscis]
MTIDWFRKPGSRDADDAGTLNACFNALDRHVVRGRAEEVALRIDDRSWTFAKLLEEAGAFSGVLRAFGVGAGAAVVVGRLPRFEDVVVSLAVARLGAVRTYADTSADDVARVVADVRPLVVVLPTLGSLDLGDTPLITLDDSAELSWATVMRAGRTDPAPCAEVDASATLAVADGQRLSVLAALGAPGDEGSVPPAGATQVDVGGLRLWSFDAPGAGR